MKMLLFFCFFITGSAMTYTIFGSSMQQGMSNYMETVMNDQGIRGYRNV